MKLPGLRRRHREPEITIVSGLPRSGTSMMMSILEAGGIPPLTDHIRTADVDNPKGYYEFERVKKLPDGNTDWLHDAIGKSVKVISALLIHLPTDRTFRVIFMTRAMEEILASQKQMLIRRGIQGPHTSDTELASVFNKHLSQVFEWLQNQPNIRYIIVDYNRTLREPKAVIDEVNQFMGGKLNIEQMLKVIDPALYRQRKFLDSTK